MDSATTTAALYAIRDSLDTLTFAVGWAILAGIFSLGVTAAWKLWL